jgi:hypothetical protein
MPRPGGVVLALGALACGLRWRVLLGLPRALGLIAVFLAGFVLAHPLGHAIGAWPAVLVVALVGGIAWRVADAPRARARTFSRLAHQAWTCVQ